MNYAVAAIGSVPEDLDTAGQRRFGDITARLLNPALSSFNAGARGYYFVLAATTWLFGPIPFMFATVGAVALLLWRQMDSPAAHAIGELRRALELHQAAGPSQPDGAKPS